MSNMGPAKAGLLVVLLHLSDYHSHAVPFYSEGRTAQGGIAMLEPLPGLGIDLASLIL